MTSRGAILPRSGARGSALPLSRRVASASGWARRGIALLSGACGALAMAPLGIFPAMAVSLTAAVWLIDGSERTVASRSGAQRRLGPTLRCAFGAGWWWGFGYFAAGLYWLGAAFLVDADRTAWLMPLGVVALPSVLAFYTALAFALARAFWAAGAARVPVLALALFLSELARGTLFTGFPWNDIGMALGTNLVLAQGASVVGLHGLTALAVLIFAAPATLADRRNGASGRPSRAPAALALAALAGLGGFGGLRLADGPSGDVPGVKLRIMQPDVFGDGSFTYANRDALLSRYIALSGRAGPGGGLAGVTHLIWPESPFPFILSRDPDALDAIARALPPGGVLVTGAARAEGTQGEGDPVRYFNAIQVVSAGPDGGEVGDTYDKVHLVPFGEYMPFMGLMERLGLSQFVPIPGGFTPGAGRHALRVPGLPPVVPVVCYEAVFTGDVVPPGGGVILNVSDDGWFGRTAGPYQHLAQARLRAIEQGLPLIRAANTGVSAIVDPYGRILEELPLGEAGVLDGFLPKSVTPTVFSEINQFIPSSVAGLLLTAILFLRYARTRRRMPSL